MNQITNYKDKQEFESNLTRSFPGLKWDDFVRDKKGNLRHKSQCFIQAINSFLYKILQEKFVLKLQSRLPALSWRSS